MQVNSPTISQCPVHPLKRRGSTHLGTICNSSNDTEWSHSSSSSSIGSVPFDALHRVPAQVDPQVTPKVCPSLSPCLSNTVLSWCAVSCALINMIVVAMVLPSALGSCQGSCSSRSLSAQLEQLQQQLSRWFRRQINEIKIKDRLNSPTNTPHLASSSFQSSCLRSMQQLPWSWRPWFPRRARSVSSLSSSR